MGESTIFAVRTISFFRDIVSEPRDLDVDVAPCVPPRLLRWNYQLMEPYLICTGLLHGMVICAVLPSCILTCK